MAQHFIYSPWERSNSPWLWLMTTLLLFSLLWLFFFVSAFLISLIKLTLSLKFSTDKMQTENMEPGSWGTRTIESCSVSLPVNIQGWFPLGLTDLISLLPKEISRVFSSSTVQKHQFFGAQPSLWSSSQILTWLLEKPKPKTTLSAKWYLRFLVCCLVLS